jgi:hypothetical protein
MGSVTRSIYSSFTITDNYLIILHQQQEMLQQNNWSQVSFFQYSKQQKHVIDNQYTRKTACAPVS